LIAQNDLYASAQPLEWDQFKAIQDPKSAYGRKVIIKDCVLIPNKARYYFFYQRQEGFRWLGVCQSAQDKILVDFGWVASATASQFPAVTRLDLTGVWRQFDSRGMRPETIKGGYFYWRDPVGLQTYLGSAFRTDGFVVADLAQTKPELGLSQMQLTLALSNRHFEYALTWFSLGLILLAFYVAMIIKHNESK